MREQDRLEGLEGLRGVAALAVVVYHGQSLLGTPILPYGYLAVDFFFLLSGFVMARAYQDRLNAGMALGTFVSARARRLFPMILAGVVLGGLARWWTGRVSVGGLFEAVPLQLALMPVPDLTRPAENLWVLDPSEWSLFWEACANLALFACLARWSDRRLRVLCILSFAGLFATAIRVYSLDAGPFRLGWLGGAARTFFGFPLGMLIWRASRNRRLPLAGMSMGMSMGRGLPVLAAVLLACLAVPNRYGFVDLAIVALAFPPLLMAATGVRRAVPWISLAARTSYPLYLCHYPLLLLFQSAGPAARGPLAFAAFVAAALVLGTAMTVWWDEPVRRWLARKAAAPAASAGGAALRVTAPLRRS